MWTKYLDNNTQLQPSIFSFPSILYSTM
uniref:Uncharacterized protein n=1 Tax=Rhizophora mucronata TaxID=61149 RepID=A0A2P2Q8K9_RHIMU